MSAKHCFLLFMAFGLFIFMYPPTQLYFLSDDWDSLLFSLHFNHVLHSYRPLSDATLYFDYSIWKLNATGFHLTNLLLHFTCVICVYFFAKILFSLRNGNVISSNAALLSGLLFLYYPFHSEAVFWIVGRGAVLCTLFSLLCFLFFIRRSTNVWFYPFSLLCFALALFCYEEAWILPLMIVVLIWAKPNDNKQTSLLSVVGFLFVFALYFGGRYWFTNDIIGTPYGSARLLDFNFFRWSKNAVALFARSMVLPMQSSAGFVFCFALILLSLVLLLFFLRKKLNLVIVISGVCFLLSLLPVIPLGIDTHDTESERFLYLPSLFFVIFLTQLFFLFFEKKFWMLFVFVFAEIIALGQSYESFRKSSKVSEATIGALSKTGSADTIFCSHLPDEYKGAFIFRNGFKSAVRLVKKDSVQSVIILSGTELFHPAENYRVQFINRFGKPGNNIQIEWQEDKVVFIR